MLLIVEIVPYVAFLGAAALVGWVGFDILREKRRKSPSAPIQESVRGLAGPPQPIQDDADASEAAPEDVEQEPEAEIIITPAEELVLPSSHAVDVASEPEQCDNEPSDSEPVEAPSAELAPEDEEDLDSDESVILVRRDPSVRVFDTAVAASERKVASE